MKQILLTLSIILLSATLPLQAQTHLLERTSPEQVGIDRSYLALADSAIQDAIQQGQIPGGVLAIVRHNKLAYLKAYGHKQLYPTQEPMTEETIFDMASLTKPLSTGIAAMQLLERGQILLQDKVQRYLPEWPEESSITIRHLLTHTSGLPAYAPVQQLLDQNDGLTPPQKLQHYIATCSRPYAPGEKLNYSCLNFVTLQYIIEKVTGMPLHQYVQSHIYHPMGLTHTGYLPTPEQRSLIAPTEVEKSGHLLHGEVHDPIARRLNLGSSGNAGLFSNAEEVAAIATMLLQEGYFRGVQILSPATVHAFTAVPKGYEAFGRTLGWDNRVGISYYLGNLTTPSVYGHTGYTGTSLTIHPEEDLAIVLLTNRVHPADTTSTSRLFATVRNIITAAIRPTSQLKQFSLFYPHRLETFASELPITPQDIVMYGNSITEGGKEWSQHLPTVQQRIVNRGISGDSSRGLLYRADEVIHAQPQKIFILIGVNDIASGIPVNEVAQNITYLVERLHREAPNTKIHLQTVLPFDESFNKFKGLNGKSGQEVRLNQLLKAVAKEHPYITLIDLYPHFLDPQKKTLQRALTYDGLHLNQEGYKVWAKVLLPYLEQ